MIRIYVSSYCLSKHSYRSTKQCCVKVDKLKEGEDGRAENKM